MLSLTAVGDRERDASMANLTALSDQTRPLLTHFCPLFHFIHIHPAGCRWRAVHPCLRPQLWPTGVPCDFGGFQAHMHGVGFEKLFRLYIFPTCFLHLAELAFNSLKTLVYSHECIPSVVRTGLTFQSLYTVSWPGRCRPPPCCRVVPGSRCMNLPRSMCRRLL